MSTPVFVKPDLFKSRFMKPVKRLLKNASESVGYNEFAPKIAIIIRTKNDEHDLEIFLKLINRSRKSYKGEIEVVVVDTESQDRTCDIARSNGVKIVELKQSKFNYPKAINLGLNAVSKDATIAFITVGHALPVVYNFIEAGVRHFSKSNVSGVYGRVIAHQNASIWEKLLSLRTSRLKHGAHDVSDVIMGVMGATNCMVRISSWKKNPFDEQYAAGGEDSAWARDAIKRNERIVFEPALSVHHSHGLGLLNYIRQYKHWKQVFNGPKEFQTEEIKLRRPDLFK